MKWPAALLLPLLLAGCARVNRYQGDFYGRARVEEFQGWDGKREPVVVLHVDCSDHLRTIGHSGQSLPVAGFSAVLIRRGARVVKPENVATNVELRVTGRLDIIPPKSKAGRELFAGTNGWQKFAPSIRVMKIKRLPPGGESGAK